MERNKQNTKAEKHEPKNDRIGKFLQKDIGEYIFAELSPAYLERCGVGSFMKGVPVPFRKADLEDAKAGKGLSTIRLSENMARVAGMDINFAYKDKYLQFIKKLWGEKFADGLYDIGQSEAEKGEFENACIYLRACLLLGSNRLKAMYAYALVCREIYDAGYENGHDDEYVGLFKAEALGCFEELTIEYPDFAGSYFYLGYAYLNMGMYGKADAVWKDFLRLTDAAAAETAETSAEAGRMLSEQRTEVSARLAEIAEPCEIEKGYTAVLTGRFESGIEILEPFRRGKFERWWPLYYYLGLAYENTGRDKDAEKSFLKVLTLNAAHIESMQELAKLYEARGELEHMQKYLKKIEIVQAMGEKDNI